MDVGRGEEGEMYGKSNTETYITICKTDSQREFAVWRWEGGSKGRGYMCLFQPWFPEGLCLGVGLLGHMVVLFLVF